VRGKKQPLKARASGEDEAIKRWRGQTKSKVARSAIRAERDSPTSSAPRSRKASPSSKRPITIWVTEGKPFGTQAVLGEADRAHFKLPREGDGSGRHWSPNGLSRQAVRGLKQKLDRLGVAYGRVTIKDGIEWDAVTAAPTVRAKARRPIPITIEVTELHSPYGFRAELSAAGAKYYGLPMKGDGSASYRTMGGTDTAAVKGLKRDLARLGVTYGRVTIARFGF
jgi:hypothetical protein